MKWYEEFDWRICVDEDTALLIEIVGIKTFIELLEKMEGTMFRFGKKHYFELKREFVRQKCGKYNRLEMKRKLGCSQSFITKTLKMARSKRKNRICIVRRRTNYYF